LRKKQKWITYFILEGNGHMSSIRNKISTKELIEAILKITNNVILLYKKPLEKDICKHNTLTCALFGNTTMSKEKMESIRKIGTKDNRNLSENNILTFIDNFYDGDQFYNYADTFSFKKSDSEMYNTDTDAMLNQVNALYRSINPYPWVDYNFLEDNGVAEREPEEDSDDTIMKQLLSLLVYTNYCRNTTVQSDYELFSKDMHDFFVCNDNFSEQLISFIAEHKPNCIAHTFSLESKTDSYTDLLRQVFPEYDFWHKDNLALQQSSPFSSEYSEEEIILSTLQPDDLVIIRNAISDKCMRILQQTHCHIIYAVPSCNPKSENFAKVSSEQLISWVLPALTTDLFELTCLLNAHRSLGSDLEIYKRVDAYYMNFKKKDIDAAKDFLEGICTSVTLAELSLRLAPYENDNWKYSYTAPKNKKPSAIYISKEISNFYKYGFQPDHDRLYELLRLLSLVQEENSAIGLQSVCKYFNLEDAFEELISLGWVDSKSNQIPLITAYSVTYGISMSNTAFDFYLATIIGPLHEHILGHTNIPVNVALFSTLIKILHQELLNYIPARTNVLLKELNQKYITNYTKGTIPEDKKIPFQDSMCFLEHGYFADDAEKIKQNPYTRATILHEPLIIEFYYSILIFCYEYKLGDLAKAIFGNGTYLPIINFMNASGYKKTLECQLLPEYYSILFGNLPFNEIQQKITQIFYDSLRKLPEKVDDEELANYSEFKIPCFMLLRVSLFHMQLTYSLFFKDSAHMEDYASLVNQTATMAKETQALADRLHVNLSSYRHEFESLALHYRLITILGLMPITDMESQNPSTFYKTHLYIYKLIREPFDISEQVSQLGNLPPSTERLVKLIQDFSENKTIV
jgi:hypothetical protein